MQMLNVVPEDSQTSQSVHFLYVKTETTWRVVGLMSSLAGLLCYTLSPSFDRLIGRWEPFKVFLYIVLSIAILTTILFAKQLSLSKGIGQLKKTCTIFAVVMIISVYSFFYDRAVDGKPDIWSVVSNAAFALVSLSLHKLFKFKSEIGVFSYFLGCFTVQLLTINWMLIFVAIIYGCLLSVIHSQGVSHVSQTVHKVVQVMMSISLRVFQAETTWRVVGSMSCEFGTLCYALSPCFEPLIKIWEPFVVVYLLLLYVVFLTTICFTKSSRHSTWYAQLITFTSLMVLMSISIASYLYDQYANGKPYLLSALSKALFALMSLSLHKLCKFEYDMDMFPMFPIGFTMQMFTINWMLNIAALTFCLLLLRYVCLLSFKAQRFLWRGLTFFSEAS